MADGGKIQRRILHTSDLHLRLFGDGACYSLKALVDLAIRIKVDLVIIAGDLFDLNRVSDNLVSFVAEQLQRLPIYVAILPGNHDCLAPGSVYERVDLWENCANVRVFRASHGETLDLPGLGVSLWGKPIDFYGSDIRPLEGIPWLQGDRQWHIAVAHGSYVGDKSHIYQSYNITHEEIVTSGCDYIALGQEAIFKCICSEPVKAYYCGSPSLSDGVAVVDLADGTGVQVTHCSL